MNRDRLIYAQNKVGFVTPNNLLLKIYPDLTRGIEVVGIITPLVNRLKDTCLMLVNLETGELVGVTESSYNLFGVHPDLCYGNRHNLPAVSILQLIPKL